MPQVRGRRNTGKRQKNKQEHYGLTSGELISNDRRAATSSWLGFSEASFSLNEEA